MNLNKVIIAGRLTRDPELLKSSSGTSITKLSLATSRKYKDKEETEFHNIVSFGKQAETINEYCEKGQLLLVEGRLQTSNWEKDGNKHYRTEVILENFQFGQKTQKQESKEEDDIDVNNIPF